MAFHGKDLCAGFAASPHVGKGDALFRETLVMGRQIVYLPRQAPKFIWGEWIMFLTYAMNKFEYNVTQFKK